MGRLEVCIFNGEGALKFLLSQDKPLYRESWLAGHISEICDPLRLKLGAFAASNPVWALVIKIALGILGGYFLLGASLGFSRQGAILRRGIPLWLCCADL